MIFLVTKFNKKVNILKFKKTNIFNQHLLTFFQSYISLENTFLFNKIINKI